jgi:hypothetical protein
MSLEGLPERMTAPEQKPITSVSVDQEADFADCLKAGCSLRRGAVSHAAEHRERPYRADVVVGVLLWHEYRSTGLGGPRRTSVSISRSEA